MISANSMGASNRGSRLGVGDRVEVAPDAAYREAPPSILSARACE
jgi:hypothetical protein